MQLLDIKRKCELLNVARSTMYYKQRERVQDDGILMNEIQDIYAATPFYGYRRVTVELRKKGFIINQKKVQRLMQFLGRRAIYPKKKTTVRNLEHKVFKYLLSGLKIERPNQVWQVDITYIKVGNGFVYLVCFIDVFSRRIMGWSLSIFLDTVSCLEALKSALKHHNPEIVNSDQGCQFTSAAWVDTLTHHNIAISMDGKGRWVDNVYIERLWRTIKQESVRLHRFDTVEQAQVVLSNYINFYNDKRCHQALNYYTPSAVFEVKKIGTKQQLFAQFALNHKSITQEIYMTPK